MYTHVETVNNQNLNEKHCKKGYTLPLAGLHLAGLVVTFLLDSGASCSLLEYAIFNKIKQSNSIKHYKIDAQIKSIKGGDLEIVHCVFLPIMVGHKQLRQRFYIVKQPLSKFYGAILGFDFFKIR